ncbi:MAG: hypothetical protein SF187_06440 [Deltaproteobacteria bacterium]|nr:hypothetical protein [Deltaproteobacteria bacterium]
MNLRKLFTWTARLFSAVAQLSGWPLRLFVFAALLAVLVPVSLRRLVDGDEGYLLMGARLVSEGQRPYADFFFPQMPGFAYVFGAWFALAARNWTMARDLCAAVCAATGLCVFELVWRGTRRRRWALLAAGFFVAHAFTLGWLTIAKTYGLTALCVAAGCVAFSQPRARSWLGLAGLCFALAAQMRLYAGVLIPVGGAVLLVQLWRERQLNRNALGLVGTYVAGALLGACVLVPSLVADKGAWWFGTVLFHGMREAGQTELVGDLTQKWDTLRSLLPLAPERTPAQIQFAVVLFPAALARLLWIGQPLRIVGLAWMALFAVSLLPTPTHDQYFSVLLPLLVADALILLSRVPWRFTWVGGAVLLFVFARLGAAELQRYTTTGLDVPGVWTTARVPRWHLRTMRKVARAIDDQAAAEGASWWPGYFVSTRTPIVRSLANDFGFRVADRIAPEQKARFHVASHADVAAMIAARKPRLFVQGNWAATPPADQLPRAGYVQTAAIENVQLWLAPPP